MPGDRTTGDRNMPRNDAAIRVRLPAALLDDAKRVAAANSRSVNAEVRHRLREAIEAHDIADLEHRGVWIEQPPRTNIGAAGDGADAKTTTVLADVNTDRGDGQRARA